MLILDALSLQLDVSVVLTLIVLITVLLDNMCTEAVPASVCVSSTSTFALSPHKHFLIGMPLSDALRVQPRFSAKVKEHIVT